MSESTIQSKINGGHAGDTVSFAAGTYALASNGSNSNGAALHLPAGLTYTGPSSGSPAILTSAGTGGLHPLIEVGGNSITLEYLTFDTNGIFVDDGVSVVIDHNVFQNIDCNTGGGATNNGIFVAVGVNNSDISYNTFSNIGNSCSTLEVNDSPDGAGGVTMYGFHNLTFTHNTFNHVFEGMAITISNSVEYDGAGGVIEYNTWTGIHRIALELLGTGTNPSGLVVAYNNWSNALNPWAGTFGLSLTAGQNMVVHDNVINGNVQSSNQYVPYGIEIAGIGTKAYNNVVEGYWGWGFSIGNTQSISIYNNSICGPSMQSSGSGTGSTPAPGNGGGFISWQGNVGSGTNNFSGNTTSSALTCGP
jgi:hypothetical protein